MSHTSNTEFKYNECLYIREVPFFGVDTGYTMYKLIWRTSLYMLMNYLFYCDKQEKSTKQILN